MRVIKAFLYLIAALSVGLETQNASAQYVQTDLFSNIPGLGTLDPNLVDPWGVSFSPTSPVWVANSGSGVATLYRNTGIQSLVVTIPGQGGSQGTPTGTVFNSTSSFNGDVFLFSTRAGQIAGWRGALGTTAETLSVSSVGASYTGLTIGSVSGNTYAYAADFHNGLISTFPGTGAPALPGNFIDTNLPAGYAPFNVQTIGNQLYVSYAIQDAAKLNPVPGAGSGIIDIFNLNGNFSERLVSNGPLNIPWGMAIAPASFGHFAGDLLVGNNGDGTIDAFDPITGMLIGMLKDAQGNPIMVSGLMALAFGNGTSFDSNALLFTGGDGIFGEIQNAETPLPAALPLFASGGALLGFIGWRRKRKVIATT